MIRLGLSIAAAALAIGVAFVAPAAAQDKKVFYILSHGGATDPFWVEWNAGANAACSQLNVDCRISFSEGDVAAQKEAFNSAIAANPDGIATTSAQPGIWNDEVKQAKDANIPVVFFNSDDPATGRLAYVGADLTQVGVMWAKYLVDHNLVKAGDKVFLPVEVPGASYQQLETQGIASVFDPLGITYDVVEAGTDPAGVISKMTDYMVANKPAAVIALGDLVASSVQKVFDAAGVAPGSIGVVGWGNTKETAESIKAGYVNAAAWQFTSAQGFMPVALLNIASEGQPIGFDIITLSLYDAATVDTIISTFK